MPEYFWGDDAQLYAMFEHYLTIMRKRLNGSTDPLGALTCNYEKAFINKWEY